MDVTKHCLGQGSGRSNFTFQYAFTLIDLLLAIAVISVLFAIASPSLSALVAKERTTILANTLSGALAYARSEAVLKQTIVLTCQSNDGLQCNRSQDWHNGWIIFADKNNNRLRENNEPLLRVYKPAANGTQIDFRGSGGGVHYYLRYKPTGAASPNGSFLVCNPNVAGGKALIMFRSGRLRMSNRQRTGAEITC